MSTYASREIAEGALDTGASGYVIKMDAAKELAKAVVAVFEGKRYISSRLQGYTSADPGDTQAPDRLGGSEGFGWHSAPASLSTTETISRHEAQFYSDDAIFLEGVTHFIGAALKTGNAAIVFATKPH